MNGILRRSGEKRCQHPRNAKQQNYRGHTVSHQNKDAQLSAFIAPERQVFFVAPSLIRVLIYFTSLPLW